MSQSNWKAYAAWVTICIVWGSTYLVIKIGVETMPPMLFAGLRWITAGAILIPFLRLRGIKFPKPAEYKHIAVVGLLLIGMANGFVVYGEQWVPSGLAALLLTTMPFWISGIESLFPNGDKFNRNKILGLLTGFVGVSIVMWDNFSKLFVFEYAFGIICILFAVIMWALGTNYSKHFKVTAHPFMNAAFQMLIAGTGQTILGLILGEHNHFHMDANGLYAMLYLMVIGSFAGYGSFTYAIQHLPVSFVSTYTYINPIIALFLGWLVLDEQLNIFVFISLAIILMGVWIVKKGAFGNR